MGLEGIQPPSVVFVNLRTGEEREMPFMPTEFTEQIAVAFVRKTVLGMSHEPAQYSNTGNYTLQGLEFFFRGTPAYDGDDAMEAFQESRKFLMSLCYPSETSASITGGGPPRVLFVWPKMISLTCHLEQLQIKHEKFNIEGVTMLGRATVNLMEIRDVRLTSEDVRAHGTIRPSVAAIPFSQRRGF